MNTSLVSNNCINWIRNWFNENGNSNTVAVIGISGGKDSTVIAGLLVKALGKDRVFGVLMPNGEQKDIEDARQICKFLGIKNTTVNISSICKKLYFEILGDTKPNERVKTNAPSRIRMTVLYSVAATYNNGNCRVANTSNLSEDILGYATIYGDNAGDFSPISKLTSDEVIEIGKYLNLPKDLLEKAPSDGMTGKTDEEVIGFSYKEINDLCRKSILGKNFEDIMDRYHKNLFKTNLIQIPSFNPDLPNFIKKDVFYAVKNIKEILKDNIGYATISNNMSRGTLIHLTKDNLDYVANWIQEYYINDESFYKLTSVRKFENEGIIEVTLLNDYGYSKSISLYVNDYIVVNLCGISSYPTIDDLKLEWNVY